MRKMAFFSGGGDPLKKRIPPITLPCPSFSYCLVDNQGSYPDERLQPGKMSLFCALVEAFIRVGRSAIIRRHESLMVA